MDNTFEIDTRKFPQVTARIVSITTDGGVTDGGVPVANMAIKMLGLLDTNKVDHSGCSVLDLLGCRVFT